MNTVQDVYNLERFIEILARIFAVPYHLIESNIARYYQAYKEERGIDALNNWVDKGGDLGHVEIFSEHIDDLEAVFKVNHIPFVTMNTILGNESPICTVVFRDKDKDIVDDIILGYRAFLTENTRELDIYSFKALMENSEITTASNLSIGEIYAFRKAMREEDFMFCIGKDVVNEGKYQIFADNKEGLTRVLAGMSYDFNLNDGAYKDEVYRYSEQHRKIHSMMERGNFYLIDGNEPSNFTYVSKKQVSTHSLVINKEHQPDGSFVDVVSDPAARVIKDAKAKDVLRIAMTYKKPIIYPESEFDLVKGYTKNGMAIEADNYSMKLNNMRYRFQNQQPSLIKFPMRKSLIERDSIAGYVNLPQNYIKEITEKYPQIYVHYDGSIAMKKEDKQLVDDYLNTKLKGLDKLKKRSFAMYINGRSGNNLMDLWGQSENVYYIVDPYHPEHVLRIDNKSAIEMKEGVEIAKVLNTSDGYERFVDDFMFSARNPIGFTEEEMLSPGRDELIETLSNGDVDNAAIKFLLEKEERERQEFIDKMQRGDENVSKEHEKAKESFLKMSLVSKVLDKQIFKEMQNKHVAKEIDHEMDI